MSIKAISLVDALETGNYDYCITGSWYILEDLLRNMDGYKDTKFVIYDTAPTADFSAYPNVYGISYRQDEGSFLAAVYQCLMTKTKKVGAIAMTDTPILNDFVSGWVAGVKWFNDTYDTDIEYRVAYLTDNTLAGNYETASVLYGSGFDIVYNIAGKFGLAAAQASEEAGGFENGIYMVGVDYDQYEVYRVSDTEVVGYENVATSMLKNMTGSVVDAMTQLIEGTAEMGNHRYSFAMDGVGLAYNERYYEVTPEDVQQEVKLIETKIVSGDINVPSFFDFDSYDEFAQFRDDPTYRIN